MRLTQVLYKHKFLRMLKNAWKYKRTRTIPNFGAANIVAEAGYQVHDANDVAEIPKEKIEFSLENALEVKPSTDKKLHPHYHEQVCYMYRNHNVLVKGLKQAKVLTKTVEVEPGLPENIASPPDVLLPDYHRLVQRILMSSNVFDAVQEKLPKLKDPARPAWNFPVPYGIPDHRRTKLQSLRMMQLCSRLCGIARPFVSDAPMRLTLTKDEDLIQFDLRADLLITTNKPLEPLAKPASADDLTLPDLYPARHLLSLDRDNIYITEDVYPLTTLNQSPHTLIIHCNGTEVVNLTEIPVSEDQLLSRTLTNIFVLAGAYARKRYGKDVEDLPEPVTLQVVHTDGKLYHFGIFQLNTLNINSSHNVKNIFWAEDRIPIYDECGYESAIPILRGYNPVVFDTLLSFYRNGLQYKVN